MKELLRDLGLALLAGPKAMWRIMDSPSLSRREKRLWWALLFLMILAGVGLGAGIEKDIGWQVLVSLAAQILLVAAVLGLITDGPDKDSNEKQP